MRPSPPRNVRKIFFDETHCIYIYILLKCALKMQEMPLQRLKIQKISGDHPPGPPYNCVVTGLPLTKNY